MEVARNPHPNDCIYPPVINNGVVAVFCHSHVVYPFRCVMTIEFTDDLATQTSIYSLELIDFLYFPIFCHIFHFFPMFFPCSSHILHIFPIFFHMGSRCLYGISQLAVDDRRVNCDGLFELL